MTGHLKRIVDRILFHSLLSTARGGIDLSPTCAADSEREPRNAPDPTPPVVGSTSSSKNSARAGIEPARAPDQRSAGSHGRHKQG